MRDQHPQIDVIVGGLPQGHICRGVIADACVDESEAESLTRVDMLLEKTRAGVCNDVGDHNVVRRGIVPPVRAKVPHVRRTQRRLHAVVREFLNLVIGDAEQSVALNGLKKQFQIVAVKEAAACPDLRAYTAAHKLPVVFVKQGEYDAVMCRFAVDLNDQAAAGDVHSVCQRNYAAPGAIVAVVCL